MGGYCGRVGGWTADSWRVGLRVLWLRDGIGGGDGMLE